jgi:hypothetical protein
MYTEYINLIDEMFGPLTVSSSDVHPNTRSGSVAVFHSSLTARLGDQQVWRAWKVVGLSY